MVICSLNTMKISRNCAFLLPYAALPLVYNRTSCSSVHPCLAGGINVASPTGLGLPGAEMTVETGTVP